MKQGRSDVQAGNSPIGAAPLVTLRDAHVHLGRTPALRGVSLQLRQGDRLMLVGANGSGKTTLLRLLHGLVAAQDPASRELHAAASVGRTGSAARPLGAMVFQRPFLLNLSVRWNLLLGLWLQGVPAAERQGRCQLALQRVGLASLSQRRARELSGGQQQRLALARAWALRPEILFLDEPTASLDPSAKREIEDLVEEFAKTGMTLVMATHNLGQAKRLGSRVAYLEGGVLVAERPVASFFAGDDLPEAARRFLAGEMGWQT